jgi:transposase InsO family protein
LFDEQLVARMRVLRETPDMRGRLPRERFYGRRKMRALLCREGITVSESKVGRLMRLTGMKGIMRGGRIITTRKTRPYAGDLVKRMFTTTAPDRIWVADLTYVRTLSGWVYVAFITDCYARRIVAAHAACQMNEKLVSETLQLALAERARHGHPITTGLIHHSDHGSQYTAIHYSEQLALTDITPSFGSIGDSYDNALAETINGLYKTECVTQDGPFHTLTDVLDATLDWVYWYNTKRLHEHLGYNTPNETETRYYKQQPLENQ